MNRWILGLVLVSALLHAEQLFKVTPSEEILMDTTGPEEQEVTTLTFDDENRSTATAQSMDRPQSVQEEVITAEEYLGDLPEQQGPAIDLSQSSEKPRIALLVPRKVIGRYADSVANAILSYLFFQHKHFTFELFDSGTESENALRLAMGKIHQKGYPIVIAPLTSTGANLLAKLEHEAIVYIPTVNIADTVVDNPNFLYGGIDYESQIDALLQLAEGKIVIFSDQSHLAKKLSSAISQRRLEDVVYTKGIKSAKANLGYLLKRNSKLKEANIFLNMPVVQSALMAAQLSRYKVPYKRLLSVQVNYSPLLFTLTQSNDRDRFYIANSIGEAPFKLEDINRLLGGDIRFNWINYATEIGMDKIYNRYLSQETNPIFAEEMIDGQVYYDTQVVRAAAGSFVPVMHAQAQPEDRPRESF